MTEFQWNFFSDFRREFKEKISLWSVFSKELKLLQEKSAENDKIPHYKIENPVVYNRALDEISNKSEIKLIVCADNPGKNEQLSQNQKYLIGQAGKLAEGFFRNNKEFKIDFRKNAIILNKTPIHSAKTSQLKFIYKNSSDEIRNLLDETQIWMAKKTAELSDALNCPIFLAGYSELKKGGIFTLYKNELKNSIKNIDSVLVFQHFSMNRFSIDFKNFMQNNPNLSKEEALIKIGLLHQKEIFDF